MVDWLAVADAGLPAAEGAGVLQAQAAQRDLGAARQCLRATMARQPSTIPVRWRWPGDPAGWAAKPPATATSAWCMQLGQLEEAADRYAQGPTLNLLGHARAPVIFGHARRRTQGVDVAQLCWQEALTLFTDIGTPTSDHVRRLLHTR
jgi:hypothetical protein